MKKATNDGKQGGTLEGKPHYDKQGNDAGGIKAVVTDAGNKPVELEGGEVIINKEASKKHWKLLSKINQSAGNGVPIHKPTDPHDEDPLEEYKGGGNIDFNVNHVPNKWILNYAKKIKENYPEVWKLGGNIFGNEAFKNLSRVSERGYWLDSEEWMYKKWQSFLARHQHDFRIAGVIAMLKWAGKVNKGWAYMKDLIESEIQKREGKKNKGWKSDKSKRMSKGGEVEENKYPFVIVIRDIKEPESLTNGTKNKYRGGYKKIFDILNEESVFVEWESADEKIKEYDFYIYFDSVPDADKIDKIKRLSNVEAITRFSNGGSVKTDCIEFVKNTKSLRNNGYYLHIKNVNIYVGDGDKTIPNVKSLILITYNSGGQSNLKASDTINSSSLSQEIAKLIGGNINVARIIVSEQMIRAKRISLNVLKGLENENIIIADRDRIVCTNLTANYEDGGSVDGGSVEGENVVSVSKYILSRHPKKGDTFKGGKVDGFKVARIVKESKNNTIIFKLYLIDSEDNKRVVMYQPKTNKIGDFQKSFLTASKGTYYTSWSDTDKMKEGGKVVTYKQKFNKKYGFDSDESHSLAEIAKITKLKLSALQDIYDKGVGAYKTNPQSVRPNVKSKEQWAMARVYSAVMGGKAAKVDANELERGRKYHLGGDMTKHLAPNGKPSNLTHEQWHLVRTPEFKAWFGDWEKLAMAKLKDAAMDEVTLANLSKDISKVIDENGEPLVVYHGSKTDLTFFDENKIGLTDRGWYGYGYYFSPTTQMSDYYGRSKPYFIKIKNPFNTNKENPFYLGGKDVTQDYISKGYDGASKTFDVDKLYHEYCVFFPFSKNIKLADGSNTTFDDGNPDIRFKDGGLTYREYVNTQFNEEEERHLPSGYLGEYEITIANRELYPILFRQKNGLEFRIRNNTDSSIVVIDGDKQIAYADNKAIMVSPLYQRKGIGLELVSILKERNPNHRFGSMTPEGFNLMGKYYDKYIANNSDIRYEDGGVIYSAKQKVLSGEINSDDAAILIYDSGFEVTDELYDELREAENNYKNKGKGIQVGDLVIVKGKYGNEDFEANYRGVMPDGKLIVWTKSGSQIAISKDEIINSVSDKYATGGNVFDKYLTSGSILDDDEILSKYGLKTFTLQNKYNIAHLDAIVVNKQNTGSGTEAMNDLIDWADENKITIALTPSTSFGATSVSRLKDYYKRFGFVENKGSNKVWSTTASMIRKPQLSKFSNGGGISDYSKVKSASSRFKPSETIVFNPPLVGNNGAKLTAYTWAYEKVMLPNYEGELVGRRVSDWTQAETSAETGRDIVHKYTIELPNGETRVVSSESVPMLLGYVDRSQAKVFGNLATASKTLAKQQMKLATLEAQQKEYNDAIKSITDKGYPKEIVVESDGFRKYQLMVGDGSCVINDDGSYDNERLQCARDSYLTNRLNEMGFDRYKSNKSWAISDLKPRIERQKRKVEQMLNTTIMENGGELAKGIETEMEHSATIDKFKRSNVSTQQVATAIAKDHLGENKNYYSRLSEVEKKMKTGGNTFSPQMDTPDGEKTRLTYFQQNIVRTQTFKEFFGDWETAAKNFIADGYRNFDVHYANVSKVIDLQTLEPVVLFHGTNSDKEFFDFDVATEKQMGRPYAYFAYEEKYSENFMQFSQRNQHGIPLKYKSFINVRKPFYAVGDKFELQRGNEDYWFKVITDRMIFDILGTNPDPQKVNDYKNVFRTQIYSFLEGVFINNNLPFWTAMARDNKSVFKRFLMTYKYDGIIYHEEISSVFEKSDPSQYTKAVTVFNANDIKLADGRNLTFDPMKSDVRYEDGGNIDVTNVEVKRATKVDELGKQLFGNQYVEKFGMFGSEKMEISQSAEQNHNNLFVQNLINKLKK